MSSTNKVGAPKKEIDLDIIKQLIRDGRTNEFIGDVLGVSEGTIRNRRKELRGETE